jgi:hypothetical protein
MSGHAATALVEPKGSKTVATRNYPSGEPFPPSRGKSPLSLDHYLSWMSTHLFRRR